LSWLLASKSAAGNFTISNLLFSSQVRVEGLVSLDSTNPNPANFANYPLGYLVPSSFILPRDSSPANFHLATLPTNIGANAAT